MHTQCDSIELNANRMVQSEMHSIFIGLLYFPARCYRCSINIYDFALHFKRYVYINLFAARASIVVLMNIILCQIRISRCKLHAVFYVPFVIM